MGKAKIIGGGGGINIRNGIELLGYSTDADIESGNFVQRIDNSYAFSAVPGARKTALIKQCEIDDTHVAVAYAITESGATGAGTAYAHIYAYIVTLDDDTRSLTKSTVLDLGYVGPVGALDISCRANGKIIIGYGQYYSSGKSSYDTVLVQVSVNYSDMSITKDWTKLLRSSGSSGRYQQDMHMFWLDKDDDRMLLFVDGGSNNWLACMIVQFTNDSNNPYVIITQEKATGDPRNDYYIDITRLDVNHLLMVYSERTYEGDGLCARVITIDDNDEITYGTKLKVDPTYSNYRVISVPSAHTQISDNKFLILWAAKSSSSGVESRLKGAILTISDAFVLSSTSATIDIPMQNKNATSGVYLLTAFDYINTEPLLIYTSYPDLVTSWVHVDASNIVTATVIKSGIATGTDVGSGSLKSISTVEKPIIHANSIVSIASVSHGVGTAYPDNIWIPLFETWDISTDRIDGITKNNMKYNSSGKVIILGNMEE
ncbi:MAG: hypothetical protein HFE72_10245 [Emergencia sp.]|nr:hypothetical protein [Emergencia sp.]